MITDLYFKVAVVAALALAIGVQSWRLEAAQGSLEREKRERAEDRAQAEQAARLESEAARATEERLRAVVQEIDDEGRIKADRLRADADAATAAGEQLRKQLAAAIAARDRARKAAKPAASSAPADSTDRLCEWLLERSHAESDEIARFADDAHSAGLACQRAYELIAQPQE